MIYMKLRTEKRGLSPVIASVLMIMLVLMLSSFVFVWASDFIEEKGDSNGVSSKKLCEAVDFDIIIVDYVGDAYDFEVVNRGDVNISFFKFRIFPGGDSNIVDSTVGVLAGGAVVSSIVLSGVIDRVEALAVLDGNLVGSSSDVVCSKVPVYVDGGDW